MFPNAIRRMRVGARVLVCCVAVVAMIAFARADAARTPVVSVERVN